MRWVVLLALGCGDAVCEDEAPGMDRDICLHDRLLEVPAAEAREAIALGRQIQDPVVRGAAVFTWISTHNREADPKVAQELCGLLEGRERSTCGRKLSQVHLRR